jgi:hypothetical protein
MSSVPPPSQPRQGSTAPTIDRCVGKYRHHADGWKYPANARRSCSFSNPAKYFSCIRQVAACREQLLLGIQHKCALFDQFPWTNHMESGVLLTRR